MSLAEGECLRKRNLERIPWMGVRNVPDNLVRPGRAQELVRNHVRAVTQTGPDPRKLTHIIQRLPGLAG